MSTFGSRSRASTATVLLLVGLVACGGGTAETTTTVADPIVGFDDMPEECVDALAGFLRAIEPAVEGIDFESSTAEDLEALGEDLESLGEEYSTTIEELDCPEPDGSDDEAFAAVIELARREAPGTVAYLEWAQGLASGIVGAEASGDCETDIAALQVFVDEGGTISELNMAQVLEVGTLVGSIATVCSPERAEEFFAEEDVAAFLEEE